MTSSDKFARTLDQAAANSFAASLASLHGEEALDPHRRAEFIEHARAFVVAERENARQAAITFMRQECALVVPDQYGMPSRLSLMAQANDDNLATTLPHGCA